MGSAECESSSVAKGALLRLEQLIRRATGIPEMGDRAARAESEAAHTKSLGDRSVHSRLARMTRHQRMRSHPSIAGSTQQSVEAASEAAVDRMSPEQAEVVILAGLQVPAPSPDDFEEIVGTAIVKAPPNVTKAAMLAFKTQKPVQTGPKVRRTCS